MALRVGNDNLSTSAIVKAIHFAKYNGAKIINASFGGTDIDPLMRDAIDDFGSVG
jgi:hypothetical protein